MALVVVLVILFYLLTSIETVTSAVSQLRTLQTMAEISVEKNSTIISPVQFMIAVQEAIATLSRDTAQGSDLHHAVAGLRSSADKSRRGRNP
jgi:hypothetical protein